VTRTARSEQLDRKGKIESVTESVERVLYRNGREVRELIRFTRDGKDLTEKEKAKRAGKEKETGHSLSLTIASPFSEQESRKYRFTLLAADPSDPAGRRIRFEPKTAPSPEVNAGEALVDPAAGTPIRIRYRPSRKRRRDRPSPSSRSRERAGCSSSGRDFELGLSSRAMRRRAAPDAHRCRIAKRRRTGCPAGASRN
jgi:hypothetical protein